MKKERKVLSIILFSLIFVSFFSGIAAAQNSFADALVSFIGGVKEVGDPLFSALFGVTPSDATLFIQVLAFLLVVLVIYGLLSTLGIFGNKSWVNFLIGVVVAVLGIRFLPIGFLEQAAIPSSAFVAVLVMGIPFFLIGAMLTKVTNSSIRRVVWVAYGVLILILWIYNISNTNLSSYAKWIYPLILLGCIIAFWFDGTLQRWWGTAKAQQTVERGTNVARDRVIAEIHDLEIRLATATDAAERNRIKGEIKNKKDALKDL